MRTGQVRRLPGTRDLAGEDHGRAREVQEALAAGAVRLDYQAIDTPVLEETELFVRKSGGELTSQLYTFVDPGGRRVSLRPEFTSSVIRHFIEEGQGTPPPARWRYAGPVFRHDRDGGAFRQFTQVGAELIGAGGVDAEVEVLALAWGGLRDAGLQDCRLRVGHLGVLKDLLAPFDLSESARLFIVGAVQDLKGGRTDVETLALQATEFGLLRDGPVLAGVADLASSGGQAARELVEGILASSTPGWAGRRTTEDIVERLIRKAGPADRPENLRAALEMVAALSRLDGPPASTLERAREAVGALGQSPAPFERLEALCGALAGAGVDPSLTVVDLGLARGIAYYTGMIFELAHPAYPDGPSLGGGGRYDGLVKALGGDDVPALGFAYTVELVVDALERQRSAASAGSSA